MFQADDQTPESLLAQIQAHTEPDPRYPLFLSIPSFYNLKWAERFVKLLKTQYDIPIIAGGRWVIDRNLDWIKKKIPEVDFFIKGCPDDCLEDFLDPEQWKAHRGECRYQKPFSDLEYTLLHDYKKYQPVIEVARGCPGGCLFCLESFYPVCPPKSPQAVLQEVEKICADYGTDTLNFYFEGAIFCPSLAWARTFQEEYAKRNMKFQFCMQSRVDAISPEVIKVLAKAGLKVLDVGLESGCPEQLLKMGKTKDPLQYLQKAERLLHAAWECGVWCKLNILLYAGENETSIQITKQWLARHRPYFKGISCNPLMLYLNGSDTWTYIAHLEQLSGKRIDCTQILQNGYMGIDLSETMQGAKVQHAVNLFYQEFMCEKDYLALKQITYTPRT